MEAKITQLSNDELYEKLKFYGIAKGPVTNTTRNLYEKRLINHLKENKIPGFDETQKQIIPGVIPPIPSVIVRTPPKPQQQQQQQPEQMQLNNHNNDVIDITPNKKKTIRIQTDYDPLVNNNFIDNSSTLNTTSSTATKSFSPQKNNDTQSQPSVIRSSFTNTTTKTYTTQTKEQPLPQQQQPRPQFEFKLLKDTNVFPQPQSNRQTNSNINISPYKSTTSNTNDDLINNLRMRQSAAATTTTTTKSSYISDQIDKVKQQEQQQQTFKPSITPMTNTANQQQQQTSSSSLNWRLYAIIIAIILATYLFYTYFLSSPIDDENLDDLLAE